MADDVVAISDLARMREIQGNPHLDGSAKIVQILALLEKAINTPAVIGTTNGSGEITATNSVPYIIGIISARHFNPYFSLWKNFLKDKIRKGVKEPLRSRIALALGLMGDRDVVVDLIKLLKEDQDVVIRCMAASALGDIGGAQAVSALNEAVRNDPSVYVKFDRLKSPVVFSPVRASAAKALNKLNIKTPVGAAMMPKDKGVQSMEFFLNSDSGISVIAAKYLRLLGGYQSKAALERFIAKKKRQGVSDYMVGEAERELEILKNSNAN